MKNSRKIYRQMHAGTGTNGLAIAKILLNTEIGPRELPGGLHGYSIYLEGWGESDFIHPLP